IALSLYCGFMITICKEQNRKWFWLGFYTLMGVGVLAKGILAVGIPCVILFIYLFVTRNLKLLLTKMHFLGIILLLLVVTPWHYLMHKTYGSFFWIEYFVRHHFARFLNSETIGRERPFLYFVPIFLVGIVPWMFLFVDMLVKGVIKCVNRFRQAQASVWNRLCAVVEVKDDTQALVLFSAISFGFIFLLFSVASTKLPTYILPAFPFAAFLMGYYWLNADEKAEHRKSLRVLTLTLASIFILASLAGVIVCMFLPDEIFTFVEKIQVLILLGLSLSGMLLTLKADDKVIKLFASYLIIMIFITTATVTKITNILYMTGEDDLVTYSSISSSLPNSKLITFDFAVKPSVKINYLENVDFLTDTEFQRLDRLLKIYEGNNVFVIVKNKNMKNDDEYTREIESRLNLLHKGYKYSLYIKP
ncbi:hypothetical protein IJV79_03495, partial [bacterium]|nr:hypothetical protein [bacterium]